MDTLNYMLLNDTISSNEEMESPPQAYKRFSNHAYLKWQRKMLKERIWANIPIPTKILNFSQGKKQSSKVNLKSQIWSVYARSKPLLGSPSIVLDMPLMEGNIYNNCTDWSNNGFLASVFSGEVFLWHPKKNTSKSITNTGGKVSKCVSWNKNSPLLAMAVNEKLISIFDCLQNKLKIVCGCNYVCTVNSITWTMGNGLISGCSSGHLTVFNRHLSIVNNLHKAHDGIIIKMALSCNESYLATSGEDKNVRVWLWPNLKEHFQVSYVSPVKGLAWHPWQDSYLAIGGGYGNGSLSIWNATNYTELGYKSGAENDAISVDNLTWSPLTGELVVSYWLKRNNDEKNSIVILSNLTSVVDAIEWHTGRVLYLLWGNNGSTLATAGADENLCMWEFLGNSSNAKKYISLRREKKIAKDIFETAKIFKQCIR
ncbi:hypothetical protein FQR65_LT05660 [Abscondita terminalis]|nr:hypothetical protein FQR65_LT05660 [Abscondita terminalis]